MTNTVQSNAIRLSAMRRGWLKAKRAFDHAAGLLNFAGAGMARAFGNRPLSIKRLRRAITLTDGRRTLIGPPAAVAHASGIMAPGLLNDAVVAELLGLETRGEDLATAYAHRVGPLADLGMTCRWMLARVLGGSARTEAACPETLELLGVPFHNGETVETLNRLAGWIASRGERARVVSFINANNLNIAVERPEYRRALCGADLVLPDGIGVALACRMLGTRLRRNLNGTDLFPLLMKHIGGEGRRLFVLGAEPEVLARAVERLKREHPGVAIADFHHGYFSEGDEAGLCERIRNSGADALVIGMGSPRQELFVARNQAALGGMTVLNLGGLIDFLGGKNRRAPLWLRQIGMEWTYRLIQEPRRLWRRYLIGNGVFLWRVSRSMRPAGTIRTNP